MQVAVTIVDTSITSIHEVYEECLKDAKVGELRHRCTFVVVRCVLGFTRGCCWLSS